MSREHLSQEDVLECGLRYFDLQAYVGTTKHMGGLAATKELAALCHIDRDTHVLDIGCGVGATPCYLARTHGSCLVGIDVHESMVEQARDRAGREGVEALVQFRIADACHLPFEDARFDVVVGESVVSFVEDKDRALDEAVRVTEPGGYVGFNEEVWLKAPSRRMIEFAKRAWDVAPLNSAQWTTMLTDAGLHDVVVRRYRAKARREASQITRYRVRDLVSMMCRTLRFYVKHPTFREYLAERRHVPDGLFDYLGYAIFVGRR